MPGPSTDASGEQSQGSRSLTRRGFGAVVGATTLASAGCLGFFGDDDDDSPGPSGSLAVVPRDVEGVIYVEQAMLETEQTIAILDGVVSSATDLFDDVTSGASYVDVLIAIDADEGTDLHNGAMYNRGESDDTYAGMVIQATTSDGVIERLDAELDGLAEATVDGTDAYRTGQGGKAEWVAKIDSEHVVFGTKTAVADALAVADGEADQFGGDLREAYENARTGPMKAAIELEEGQLEDIASQISSSFASGLSFLPDPTFLTVAFEETEVEALFDFQLTMESTEDAEQAKGTLDPLLDEESDLPIDNELIDQLSVKQEQKHVTIQLSTTTEELAGYFGGNGSTDESLGSESMSP